MSTANPTANSGTEANQGRRLKVVELPDGLERVFPVIKELRPDLELGDYKRLVMLAHTADGYRVVAAEVKGDVVGVMGYRILHDLLHGSHLYIDDLVVTAKFRSLGHGSALLNFAEGEARRLGLSGLRLSTGTENTEAKKFYEREGWDERSVSFKKKVPSH